MIFLQRRKGKKAKSEAKLPLRLAEEKLTGDDQDPSWCVAVTFDKNSPDVSRQRVVSHSLRPLDHYHGLFIGQQVIQIHCVRSGRAFIQTIKVQVIKLQASRMRVHERERRAGDFLFCDTQSSADAFHKDCLTGSEGSTEQQDLATLESRTYLVPVIERLLWR